MSLQEVAYRLSTDKRFAEGMRADPRAALQSFGIVLKDDDLRALMTVLDEGGLSKPLSIEATEDPLWWVNQLLTAMS
ncbi:MAG: hypothetical protein PVF70_12545 [Anaerolineales bacterium]|jgi:hypothetical protein